MDLVKEHKQCFPVVSQYIKMNVINRNWDLLLTANMQFLNQFPFISHLYSFFNVHYHLVHLVVLSLVFYLFC